MLRHNQNLTQVASALFMTQPALTKRLQQIEKEFNTVIATRNNKGFVFTPQGEFLTAKAEEFLNLLEDVKQKILMMDDGTSGTLKIGTSHSFARFVLPSWLQRYRARYSNIEFDIKMGLSGEVVKLVRSREVHLGFIRGDHEYEGEKLHLFSEQAYIVSKSDIPLERLPELPRIEYDRDPVTVRMIDHWWKAHFDKPPTIAFHVNNLDNCWEMVSNGLGFGIFFGPTIRDDFFKLSMLTPDGMPIKRNTWMIYRSDYTDTPLLRNFINFVDEMKSLSS